MSKFSFDLCVAPSKLLLRTALRAAERIRWWFWQGPREKWYLGERPIRGKGPRHLYRLLPQIRGQQVGGIGRAREDVAYCLLLGSAVKKDRGSYQPHQLWLDSPSTINRSPIEAVTKREQHGWGGSRPQRWKGEADGEFCWVPAALWMPRLLWCVEEQKCAAVDCCCSLPTAKLDTF